MSCGTMCILVAMTYTSLMPSRLTIGPIRDGGVTVVKALTMLLGVHCVRLVAYTASLHAPYRRFRTSSLNVFEFECAIGLIESPNVFQ